MSEALELLGFLFLAAFAYCIWPPAAFLPMAAYCIIAGYAFDGVKVGDIMANAWKNRRKSADK